MMLHYMVEKLIQSSKRCYSVKVSRFIVDIHDTLSGPTGSRINFMQLQWQEILIFYTVINSWSVFDIYIYISKLRLLEIIQGCKIFEEN